MITGPEEGAAAGHSRLRASHADREQVIDTLKTAFADGRLDKGELDVRVGQAFAARTYGELAMVTADIPTRPARARPAARPARRPVRKNTVKWGLVATGAMVPPAMFVAGAYGVWWLVLPAFPLLFIELIVAVIVVASTLARQRDDRSRASRGQLPPRPGQAGRAEEAERHGSTGPDPALPGARTGQTSADLRVHRTERDRPRRGGQGVPVPPGARPTPGAASPARAGRGLGGGHLALNDSQLAPVWGSPDAAARSCRGAIWHRPGRANPNVRRRGAGGLMRGPR